MDAVACRKITLCVSPTLLLPLLPLLLLLHALLPPPVNLRVAGVLPARVYELSLQNFGSIAP